MVPHSGTACPSGTCREARLESNRRNSVSEQAKCHGDGSGCPLSSPFPIDSTPPGADIEIDGRFVGNTPSTVSVAAGSHQIAVKKKGFTGWSKTLNVTGGTVHLIAELEQEPAKQ